MKKKTTIIVIALIAAVLAAVSVFGYLTPIISRQVRIAEQFRIAAEYIEQHDYESARLSFERVLEIDPKNTEAHIKIADIYLANEDPEAAFAVLQTALEQISVPEFAFTLVRVINDLIVGDDILRILDESGILGELPIEELIGSLIEAQTGQ